jgi:SAM-dependent methyltransferase
MLNDPELVRAQYANDRNLAARQALWRNRPAPSFQSTVLDVAQLRGDETVLDAGCGNGLYLTELRERGHAGPVLGIDLSAAMARIAADHAWAAIGDIQALPLADACVDAALSLHMLYHVPEPEGAVAELRRVLRPGGALTVVMNGPGHAAQLVAVLAEATRRVTGEAVDDSWAHALGPDETARLLGGAFDTVTEHDLAVDVPIDEPEIVVAAIASRTPDRIGLADGPTWTAVLRACEELLAEHFATHSTFWLTSEAVGLRAV